MKVVLKIAGALLLAAIVAAVLFPVFAKPREGRGRSPLSPMKMLSVASMIYASDFDERLPLGANWTSSLVPYTKNARLFNDPMLNPPYKHGFAFYSSISGKPWDWIERPGEIPMIIQSEVLGENVHADLSGLPKTPRIGGDRDAYANADTSVKVRPRAWALTAPKLRLTKPILEIN